MARLTKFLCDPLDVRVLLYEVLEVVDILWPRFCGIQESLQGTNFLVEG